MGIRRAADKSKTSTRSTKSGRTVTKTKEVFTGKNGDTVRKTKVKTGGGKGTVSKKVTRTGTSYSERSKKRM